MPDQFVSGNEITANPGNPGLGYSSGVQYNANPNIANPFQGISSTLSQIQSQTENRRLLDREQKLKEQEDLAKFLATTGQSAFNIPGEGGKNMGFDMLQEDRDIVNSAADDLRKKVVSSPQSWKFDPEIKKKQAEYQQLLSHAGVRAIDIAKKQQLAAATNNPVERDRILKNIESEKKKPVTDFSMPEPYMPEQTFDINKYLSEDVISGKNKEAYKDYKTGTSTDKEGNEIITTQSGITDNVLDFRPKAKQGSAEYDNAINLARNFYGGQQFKDPHAIISMNQNIDTINQQRGYQPGSTHYIPHVAEVMPNGQIQPNNVSPADVAYAVIAEHYGRLQPSAEINRSASELGKEKNDIQMARANSRREEEKLKLQKAEFEEKKGKLSKDEREKQQGELESRNIATTIYKTLANSKSAIPIQDIIDKIPEAEKGGLIQTISNSGIDLGEYNVSHLNPADATVKNIAGVQYVNQQGQLQKGVARPTYAYVAMPKSGSISDAKFVIGYPEMVDAVWPAGSKKGGQVKTGPDNKPLKEKITNWKIISPQEAVGSYVTSRSNFGNITTTAQSRMDVASDMLTDMMGGTANSGSSKNKNILADEIASVESDGGDYGATNSASSAIGKYQFLWSKHKDDIEKITGVKSKEEFLKSPVAQEKYYKWHEENNLMPGVERIKKYNSDGYSDTQLAKLIHFKGEEGAIKWLKNHDDSTSDNNMSIEDYVGSPTKNKSVTQPITKTAHGKKYEQINGQWYPVQ